MTASRRVRAGIARPSTPSAISPALPVLTVTPRAGSARGTASAAAVPNLAVGLPASSQGAGSLPPRPQEPTAPLTVTFRAMASKITLRVVDPTPAAPALLDAARQTFARVEAACTRFDPTSPLMRANAAGDEWCAVPPECYSALIEAARAHVYTDGLFDPRVLDSLRALGYDRTLSFASGELSLNAAVDLPGPSRDAGSWSPGFDLHGRVRIGPRPVDLGGIGKGLAVRWASDSLAGAGRAHLIEAGGDCYLAGDGPDGTGWRVAVEDPRGGAGPVAVLRLQDAACATSSLRRRSWRVDGRRVHHLIDPRTGASAAGGLSAVTVVAADTARAEVWSKALLIAGRDGIAALGEEHGLAALWVDEEGRLGWTPAMLPSLMWVCADA